MPKSVVWRIRNEPVASLEAFDTEAEMEYFLAANPRLIDCQAPMASAPRAYQHPIRRQLAVTTGSGARGRTDLLGVGMEADTTILKLFELKNVPVTVEHVEQLLGYLEGWRREQDAKADVRDWLRQFGLQPAQVEGVVEGIRGVMVGPSFDGEAIKRIVDKRLAAIRLTRFRSDTPGQEYLILIEDQVGEIVKNGTTRLSWDDLGINGADRLYLEPRPKVAGQQAKRIYGVVDTGSLTNRFAMNIVLEAESVQELLTHEQRILERSKTHPYPASPRVASRGLEAIKASRPVPLSIATALAEFALDDQRTHWDNPSAWWVVERTGQTLEKCRQFVKDRQS